MKIIAVNIKHNVSKMTIMAATERAWRLNINNARLYDYVIGVAYGSAKGFFKIESIVKDKSYSNRVRFNLIDCSPTEKKQINSIIKNINTKGFVTKYIN